MSKEGPWYGSGLRFECTQCGNCCKSHGEYAYIYLMEPEVEAIAAHLGLALEEFRAAHCWRDEDWTIIRTTQPACPYLGEDNRCGIYPVRPVQCRTWPFWEENLKRRATWEGAVKDTCPGIGSGRLYSAEEVGQIARANEEWYVAEEESAAEEESP